MKTLFKSLLAIVCGISVASAQSSYTSVMIPAQSMFNGMAYAKPIVIMAAFPLVSDGTSAFAGTTLQVPISGGTNPIVQLVPNDYTITFPDARAPWRITVPASTNVLNAVNLAWNLHSYNFQAPWSGDLTNSLATASNAVATGLWPAGGAAIWASSGGVIYPNGFPGTNNGWISTGPTLYPQ